MGADGEGAHACDLGWHGGESEAVGRQLVEAVLSGLRAQGAAGCVVLGDPAYYARFGFRAWPPLRLPGVPAEYFQALPFGDDIPVGDVAYAPAFDATA